MYRFFLENDLDKKFDGGIVRFWGQNLKEVARTSGVSILKQTYNSGDVQQITVDVKPNEGDAVDE